MRASEQDNQTWSERTLPLLRDVEAFLSKSLPIEITLNPPDVVTLTLCYACVSRFRAIILLLSQQFADEALVLLRSLLADTQRLLYVRKQGPAAKSALLGLWKERLANARKLAEAAKRTKQPGDGAELFEFVARQERLLEKARERYGIRKLARPLKEGATIAQALDRPDDEIDYLLATFAAHGKLLSAFSGLHGVREDLMAFSLRTMDFALCTKVGVRAAQLCLDGLETALELLDWSPLNDLRSPMCSLRGRLAEAVPT